MPRNEWSEADERMYRHVRQSEMDRGRSESRAEEIAARTVNSHRREEGRTASKRTTWAPAIRTHGSRAGPWMSSATGPANSISKGAAQ